MLGVCYIERPYKSLLSHGEQTLIQFIESSYYRGFVLLSVCASFTDFVDGILTLFRYHFLHAF